MWEVLTQSARVGTPKINKFSKIAALVIGWVTAGRNLVGRIGDRPRFPGVAGSNLTGG